MSPASLEVLLVTGDDELDPRFVEAWQEEAVKFDSTVLVRTVTADEVPAALEAVSTSHVALAEASTTPSAGALQELMRVAVATGAPLTGTRVLPIENVPLRAGSATSVANHGDVDPAFLKAATPIISDAAGVWTIDEARNVGHLWGGSSSRAAIVTNAVLAPGASVCRGVSYDARAKEIANPPAPLPAAPPTSTHASAATATSLALVLQSVNATMPPAPAEALAPADRPFLSIVTRTQGKRLQSLADVLTCLRAQTVRDFEVRLVAHRTQEAELKSLRAVVDAQPQWLRERIHIDAVERAGRAAPLNEAFEAAQGRYIVALDDDDTVTADWVSTFRDMEGPAGGRLIRCGAMRLDVVSLETLLGEGPHKAVPAEAVNDDPGSVALPISAPVPEWPMKFELIDHMRANYTPFMTVAFPRSIFHDFGLRFDETLDTTEDWDYIVRSSSMLGVADATRRTAVYRWWLTPQSSRSVHSPEEWEATRLRVVRKLDSAPVILPKGAASRIPDSLNEAWDQVIAISASQHQTNLEMTKTANAHDEAVANWQAAEQRAVDAHDVLREERARFAAQQEKISQLREKVAQLRGKMDVIRERSARRTDLVARAAHALANRPDARPSTSLTEMALPELSRLVEELEGTRPGVRSRIVSRLKR